MTDDKEYLTRVELTHAAQVERFGWCICEDTDGQGQLAADCPVEGVFNE
jgi:hypothetical protein